MSAEPSEIVERVARALNSEFMSFGNKPMPRDTALGVAWAAIAAMREPTQAMILAGVHHGNMGDMAGRWQSMIDAALVPQTSNAPPAPIPGK